MGVKVRVKRGQYYLDIYHQGVRRWECLHLARTGNPAMDREMDRLADICRAKREMQLVSGEYNVPDKVGGNAPLYEYIVGIRDSKTSPENYTTLLSHLNKMPGGREIRLKQIGEPWLMAWRQYLQKRGLASSTQSTYDNVLRAVLNQAVKERRIPANPCKDVKCINPVVEIKDILTIADLEKLISTPVPVRKVRIKGLPEEAKRAFLFACWTGLRISDLRTLEWRSIEQDKIRLLMKKTKKIVEIPLHPMAMVQLEANDDRLVFPLVGRAHSNLIKYFRKWAAAAGVDKHLGWHTARRTFATLAVESGVDQYVISKLLGHANIRQTAVYSQVPITTKRAAVAKLPDFGLLK